MINQRYLCDRCQKREATVLYRSIVNGQETRQRLCPVCAQQAGLTKPFQMPDPFDGLFGGLFMQENRAPREEPRCPTCGITLKEVRSHGRFGCGKCYEFFENRIDWSPFTSRSGYRGRHPDKADSPAPHPARETPEQKLAALKKQLAEAVQAEHYEQAAALRDRIRAMEKEKGE